MDVNVLQELPYLTLGEIHAFIDGALAEDEGDGDHSTLASVPEAEINAATIYAKGKGRIAGVTLAEIIFHYHDPNLRVTTHKKDGDLVNPGDQLITIIGEARTLLTLERLVLNCMQRMSGIATYTFALHQKIAHTSAKILDTRKTTPLFRPFEKWAVHIGGGHNHRMGLYDMIMLKDNHIAFAGGIQKAISATRKYLDRHQLNLQVEIETRTLDEVQEVLKVGRVDRIMLDNMDINTLLEAIRMIDGQYETEASGGITESSIVEVAETGVDFISIGALTHSYTAMDISMKADT